MFRTLLCVLALAVMPLLATAQTSTGSIDGLVTDSTGGALPGALVTLTNVDTADTRTATANGSGSFTFSSLVPANYKVSVTFSGFKQFEQGPMKLDVASTISLPIKLQVGSSSETVEVTSSDPPLATQSSALAYQLETKTIEDLPTNGRNPYGFAALVPGVNAPSGFTQLSVGMYNEQFVSINGSRNNQSSFQLDGGDNSNSAFNGPTFYPSIDDVQEYKVQVNNFSAEFGNTSGGVVNVITKSGTKNFHGSAFEFARNNIFDANNYFAKRAGIPIGSYKYNQFGGSLGGPLTIPHLYDQRERTFFFLSYEGLRFTQSVTATGSVPTELERTGDFSQSFDADGNLVVIYDPATTRVDPSNSTQYIRDAFVGNKIDPSRFDSVSKNILPYFPHPNTAGNSLTHVNNFVAVASANTVKDTGSVRIDHVISPTQRLFGRYSQNLTIFKRPNPYAGTEAAIAAPTLGTDRLMEWQHVLDYTNALRPNLVMELNSSYNRYMLNRTPPGYGFDPTKLGFPSYFNTLTATANLAPCFPQINTGKGLSWSLDQIGVGGEVPVGVCGQVNNAVEAYQEIANFTSTIARHTIKFGAVFQVDQNYGKNNVDADGVYGFRTDRTQGPNPYTFSSQTGSSFASFLLGTGNYGDIGSSQPPIYLTTKHYGVYFQDDWRVTPKLTLNLGVRYDINTPYTERLNRLTQIDMNSPSPLQVAGLSLKGGFQFPGINGRSRYLSDIHYNQVVPRVGLAFSPDNNTVFRGGFGMFYGPVVGSSTPSDGFSTRTSWVTSLDGVHPINPLSDPFPTGFSYATGSSLGLSTLLGQGGTGINTSQKVSVTKQWNVDVQHSFPGAIVMDLAYAGSQGTNLYNYTLLNQLPDQYLSLGSALNNQVANPFYGKVSVGTLSYPEVAREQLLVPYPQFTYLNTDLSNGESIYNALQLSVNKRYSNGLSFQGSYTWSKGIDNLGGPVQDFYNLKAERAVFSNDLTHNLSISGVWELPFGKGKRYLRNGIASAVLGNWQYNGIATFKSGYPLSIGVGTNTLNNNGPSQRASYNPAVLNASRSGAIQNRLDNYYNIDAFIPPGQFTFGNTPRYLSNLRAPGVANYDMSLFKNVPIRDGLKVEFRVEAFNIFNRVQFAAPDTTTGSTTAGVISSQINQPRDLQLAVRAVF
ncbi:MAG: TonB-dependent receptor [Acidobacteriaceae bacterium]|nr:TonB-dependent receptor [Acidobacteriaceae bacterium]